MPEFEEGIKSIPADSKLFVEKSLEIVDYIFHLMEEKRVKQKELAEKMGKSEAEVSKILGGMHNLTLRSIARLEAALGETIVCTPKNRSIVFPETQIEYFSLKGVKSRIPSCLHSRFQYETKIINMFDASNTTHEGVMIK